MSIKTPDYSNLNMDEMAETMGIKEKYVPLLVDSFVQESNAILEKLKSSIAEKDYESIRIQIHSLKGSAGNLHFKEIYDMSREMELAGANKMSEFDYIGYLEAIKSAIDTIRL